MIFSCSSYDIVNQHAFCVVLGTSEAFLHAVGSKRQLMWSNMSLLLFSAIYITLNVLLVQYAGAVGLIAANSCSILFLRSPNCSFAIVLSESCFWTYVAVKLKYSSDNIVILRNAVVKILG